MRLLERWIEPERTCSYLSEERASLETFLALDVSPGELDALLHRGWRRFGPAYFRPACRACDRCDSLRIPVARFSPSKSQRRAMKKASRFSRTVSVPLVDHERLALYRKWHASREDARGWDSNPLDAEGYAIQLAFPHPSAREIAFRDGERLIGVGLWDDTPSALSAVYFFSDPEYARESLGVANVVLGIEQARAAGKEWVYLGYRVQGCASLEYKGRFVPHEQLIGRPALRAEPEWSAVESDQPESSTSKTS